MPEKELPAVVTTAKKNKYENLVTDGSTSEAQVESKPNDEVVENRYIGEIVPFSIESEKMYTAKQILGLGWVLVL